MNSAARESQTSRKPVSTASSYAQSDIGFLPVDWSVRKLAELFSLKNGFAFSSSYFSKTGPIILTPGNFRLVGGLYFDDRNTKRYSGPYPSEAVFRNGDLLIVMTDLTPNCNLLGKPAFVEMEETVLHNQRIGKVILKRQDVEPRFLYYLLLSRIYLDRIKEMATGSTVRHTSNGSIYSVHVPFPPLSEQRVIGAALSDVDELIGALDKLIAKKRAIKLAAMQQLLTGKTRLPGFSGEWKTRPLGELAAITMGQSPSSQFYNTSGDGLPLIQGNADLHNRRTIERVWTTQASKRCNAGDLLLTVRAPVGAVGIATKDACLGRGVCGLSPLQDPTFLFQSLVHAESRWKILEQGSTFTAANSKQVSQFELHLPDDAEQVAIAAVLSDMDTEITALEQRRDKTKTIKQGMMQSLLTGRVRLVEPKGDE